MQKITGIKRSTTQKTVKLSNGQRVSARTLRTVRGAARAIVRTHKTALLELGDR